MQRLMLDAAKDTDLISEEIQSVLVRKHWGHDSQKISLRLTDQPGLAHMRWFKRKRLIPTCSMQRMS